MEAVKIMALAKVWRIHKCRRIYESRSGHNGTIYTFRHKLIYDHKHRQIYDYITRASTNTGSGEYTNPDLGAMELYTHLGTG